MIIQSTFRVCIFFSFCSIPNNSFRVSLLLKICSIPPKKYLFTLFPGCLDSYNGQCRLEAFAVPMFCFLLQNTTEAKSY